MKWKETLLCQPWSYLQRQIESITNENSWQIHQQRQKTISIPAQYRYGASHIYSEKVIGIAGLRDSESNRKNALKLGLEPIMSKVIICWEILAGRTLHAENDRRTRLKNWQILAQITTLEIFFSQTFVLDFI